MRNLWISVIALAVISGCSPEYDLYTSSTSPDGKHIIDITREIQATNDPDVFWQHISVRPTTTSKPITPGNVAVYSCYSPPVIKWKSNTEVELKINAADVGSSFKRPPNPKSIDGISVVFVIR
jgi:hypothetical protein